MDLVRSALSHNELATRVYAYAQDGVLALLSCLDCADAYGTVCVNGVSYNVMQLLGEGGFSMVYLVRDPSTGSAYALKKMRCQHGDESLRMALGEIQSMQRFRDPHVLRLIDSAVVQDQEGRGAGSFLAGGFGRVPSDDVENPRSGKIVYLVLPY